MQQRWKSFIYLAILAMAFTQLPLALPGVAGTEAAWANGSARSHVEVLPEKSKGRFDVVQYQKKQIRLFEWLMSEQVPGTFSQRMQVNVTERDLADMEKYQCESCREGQRDLKKIRVGVTKPLGLGVDFTNLAPSELRRGIRTQSQGMMKAARDGGFVWSVAAESPSATALRVHFTNFSLPANTEMYIYNQNGQAFGPYTGKGPNGTGDFWTHTVTGDVVFVQLRHFGSISAGALHNIDFVIEDVAHLGKNFLVPFLQQPEQFEKSICSFNAECIEDAQCYSSGTWSKIDDVRTAIAHMQFVSGAYIYICSGGLMADTDDSTEIPYFLTANHCISKSTEASSLECFWRFWTSSCNGACYDPVGSVPRTLGADIVQHSRKSDYCLLQLREAPPSGSTFLGWTSDEVAYANNYELFRISHPSGAPQAFSKHEVDADTGTCRSWPRGGWIYSTDVIGATEGGSSGSPVLNAAGQVVGQLSGACGYNLNDVCDSASNSTVDGAFAAYYEDVAAFLNPSGGGGGGGETMHVHAIVLTVKKKGKRYDGIATVTIVDESGSVVAGAEVTGTFSGDFNGTVSATTDADGVAVLKIGPVTGATSFSFCVDDVTHATLTYDSAGNVETCDSF